MMENQQLIKKDRSANSYSKIFPWTFTDLVLDRVTKESLDNILVRNNFIALPYVGSKAATRLQVPMKNRRRGIWLSYIDYAGTLTVEYYNDNNLDDNHWQDSSYWLPYNTAEFQPASVGLSALAQEVFDWINSQITTAVKLNPEDLQKNSSGQIEEANRAYDTSTFSGLGYRILRKNIKSNKNVLTQSMINMPNNVYKIRYDFDLNGATINLPANSVLQFVGGSIKNGTLNGNNTVIEADSNAVIFDSVVIEGTWNVEHIYDSWFAFNTSPSYVSNQIITNILALSNDDVYNTIHFDADRTYYFELPYKGKANLGDDVRPNYWLLNTSDYDFLRIFTGFTSNTHLIVNNTIQMLPTNQGAYFIFHIENKENIMVSGTGTINGDAKDHLYTDPFTGTDYYGEWGHVLNFRSCNNVVVRDITIGYAFGDGIALGNAAYNNNGVKEAGLATKNVTIDAVKVLYARRNGISLGGNNYTITNVYFEGNGSDTIKGTAPMAAIDFENDYVDIEPSGLCTNVSMNNCKFKDNKYDVSSTIRDDLYEVPRGELVNISDCNFTSPLRLNRTNGLTFSNCHIVGITNVDNSIAAWYVSKDLVFNNCVFDELNPYLAISAEEQNKKFINPTYPEDIRYSTTFQHSLPVGRALKFTIPKPLVGEVEFTAFCSNPNYSNIQMPVNTTIYTFGPSQRLTGIRDIKIKASQDSTPRYSMYKNTPVFSYINYTEDSNNFIIYFAIGGDLIGDSYASATSVNIFLTSKTKFITVENPVSGRPDYAGMYGGKWSELSAIIKESVDISSIPSTVTFPSKEMYSGNMLADLPTSLTADKVGFSQFVLDGTYKRPVFWDSYSNVFRTADGNKALERRVTSLAELDVLTAKLTVDDRGYVVYYTVTTSYLTWRGTDWTNEDGSLFSKVKYIKQTNTIDILNIMFSYSGVIYKICADIDLGGGTLTIATGSILDFQGGSFSNGTIVGGNTKIIAGLQKIFNNDIILTGTWNVEESYPEWFGAVGDGVTNDTIALTKCINYFTVTFLSARTYITDQIDNIPSFRTIKGCGKKSIIQANPSMELTNNYLLRTKDGGSGIIFSDFVLLGGSNSTEANYKIGGILLRSTSNDVNDQWDTRNVIQNVEIKNCYAASIYIGTYQRENKIVNCFISHTTNVGINCNGTDNMIIGCTVAGSHQEGIIINGNNRIDSCKCFGCGASTTETGKYALKLIGNKCNVSNVELQQNNYGGCIIQGNSNYVQVTCDNNGSGTTTTVIGCSVVGSYNTVIVTSYNFSFHDDNYERYFVSTNWDTVGNNIIINGTPLANNKMATLSPWSIDNICNNILWNGFNLTQARETPFNKYLVPNKYTTNGTGTFIQNDCGLAFRIASATAINADVLSYSFSIPNAIMIDNNGCFSVKARFHKDSDVNSIIYPVIRVITTYTNSSGSSITRTDQNVVVNLLDNKDSLDVYALTSYHHLDDKPVSINSIIVEFAVMSKAIASGLAINAYFDDIRIGATTAGDKIAFLNEKGTTSARPTLALVSAGFKYYDTTLNKYIMSNGTAWTNLDGTALT